MCSKSVEAESIGKGELKKKRLAREVRASLSQNEKLLNNITLRNLDFILWTVKGHVF